MRMLLPDQVMALSPAGIADAHEWPANRRWVRAVMVSTADGAASSPAGLSGGISSPSDRLLFATLRGLADVIIVGAETARKEGYGPVEPRHEVAERRRLAGQSPAARLAIVSRSGALDPSSALFTGPDRPIVITVRDLPPERLAALTPVADIIAFGEGSVDFAATLDQLSELGLTRISCEGGPHLLGDLVAAGLVDELCLSITPLISGGTYADGQPVPRILAGIPLPDAPHPLRLAHVMEDHGTVFLSYLLE